MLFTAVHCGVHTPTAQLKWSCVEQPCWAYHANSGNNLSATTGWVRTHFYTLTIKCSFKTVTLSSLILLFHTLAVLFPEPHTNSILVPRYYISHILRFLGIAFTFSVCRPSFIHYHLANMELGHLLTRSGLTHLQVSPLVPSVYKG